VRVVGSDVPAAAGNHSFQQLARSLLQLQVAQRSQTQSIRRAHRGGGSGDRAAAGGAGARGGTGGHSSWPPGKGRSRMPGLCCMSCHRRSSGGAGGSHCRRSFRCCRLEARGGGWWGVRAGVKTSGTGGGGAHWRGRGKCTAASSRGGGLRLQGDDSNIQCHWAWIWTQACLPLCGVPCKWSLGRLAGPNGHASFAFANRKSQCHFSGICRRIWPPHSNSALLALPSQA